MELPEPHRKEFARMDQPQSRALSSEESLIPQHPSPSLGSAISGTGEGRGVRPDAVHVNFKFYFIYFIFFLIIQF